MKILILSGPTHEYLDPVRFIGNASSGRMGKALAEEALNNGYFVEFVTGPVSEANLPALGENGSISKVISARDMLSKASDLFSSAHTTIFTAAVADYSPADKQTEKMPKSSDNLMLELKPTPDIAQTLSSLKRNDQITIGFALQTADGEKNASRKLERKKLDGIVLNTPATLGADTGTFSFLSRSASGFDHWGCINKQECAKRIFQAIEQISREK